MRWQDKAMKAKEVEHRQATSARAASQESSDGRVKKNRAFRDAETRVVKDIRAGSDNGSDGSLPGAVVRTQCP